MKVCSSCGVSKTLDSFYKRGGDSNLLRYNCKACQKLLKKEDDRARHRRDPRAQMVVSARSRAKKKGIVFDITREDIIIPKRCPLLGIPLEVGNGKMHRASPSLDRLFPELGYVKGNVRVISYKANSMKQDATAKELKRIGRRIDSYLQGV